MTDFMAKGAQQLALPGPCQIYRGKALGSITSLGMDNMHSIVADEKFFNFNTIFQKNYLIIFG